MFDQHIFFKKERILELITDEINIYDLFVDHSFRRDSVERKAHQPGIQVNLRRLYHKRSLYKPGICPGHRSFHFVLLGFQDFHFLLVLT